MTCVEYIVLRAPECDSCGVSDLLSETFSAVEKPDTLRGFWILRHKTIMGDVAALLIWAEDVDSRGSRLGQQIRSVMSSLGIVSYSVWSVTQQHEPPTDPCSNQ